MQSNYNNRLFETCNICWHIANVSKQLTLYSAEAYSEPRQPSKMKLFVKIVNAFQSLTIFAKAPSWKFDEVLNTPLFRKSKKQKTKQGKDKPRYRSSRPEVFRKKVTFKNFTKFTWKHLFQSLLFNKTLLKKGFWHRCFPGNFVKFLKTLFLYRTPPVPASEDTSFINVLETLEKPWNKTL